MKRKKIMKRRMFTKALIGGTVTGLLGLNKKTVGSLITPETVSITTPEKTYYYALHILERRFPEGEEIIAKSPGFSYLYAKNVLRRRFPKGEKAIAKSSDFSYRYARNVLKSRFPEGEKAIIETNNAKFSYCYAHDVIKGRFPEGEKIIAKSPEFSYFYAKFVLKDRFPEGENCLFDIKYYYENHNNILDYCRLFGQLVDKRISQWRVGDKLIIA